MRPFRTLALVSSVLVFALASTGQACTVSSAMVSGKFNEEGQFEVISALDSKGNALPGAAGMVLAGYSTADGLALAPADYTDETLYVVGDLNFDDRQLYVASYTQCAKTAGAKVSAARTASAGAGCCAAKARAAAASAQVASGSGCSSSAKSAAAQAAVAGAGCSASKSASTRTASTKVTNASGCSGYKSTKSAAAAASDRFIVFNVSGMTCGGCSSKVEAAVAALEMDGVKSCVVSFSDGTAIVYITKDVDAEALQTAISEAGFPAELARVDGAEKAPAQG